jgi:hypothetical protein
VLVRTGITYKRTCGHNCEGSIGDQGAIPAWGIRKIQRPRGQADPAEVGVLHHFTPRISQPTTSKFFLKTH